MKRRDFELLLFSTDAAFIKRAVTAGVDGIIVDWENRGKAGRQAFADTEINNYTVDDLLRVRRATEAKVVCRINAFSHGTRLEIAKAIEGGADEILLPMLRSLEEVEAFLEMINGRCAGGILVETVAAVGLSAELARLPLARVYVGLNDLSIERGTPNIFTAVADGTVERARRSFDLPFGFGGLTLPERGHPIPCRLLIGEMARLDCSFSFLRRSFHRDLDGKAVEEEIPRIKEALTSAFLRDSARADGDRRELLDAIRAWTPTEASRS